MREETYGMQLIEGPLPAEEDYEALEKAAEGLELGLSHLNYAPQEMTLHRMINEGADEVPNFYGLVKQLYHKEVEGTEQNLLDLVASDGEAKEQFLTDLERAEEEFAEFVETVSNAEDGFEHHISEELENLSTRLYVPGQQLAR